MNTQKYYCKQNKILIIMKKFIYIFAAVLFCTNVHAQQLNESFEGTTFPPDDWSSIDSDQYSKWKRVSKDDNASLDVFDGRACAVVPGTYGTTNYLITPCLRPAAGEKLHFASRVKEYASQGFLKIEVSSTGTDAASFTEIASYSTSSRVDGHLWKTEWREYDIDLSAYAGQRIFVAFRQVGEADNIYLDKVSGVTLAGDASCEPPYNLTVSNLTSSSATVAWAGSATQYQYVCVADGQTVDWSAATLTSATTVTLNGLSEATAYACYVRSYCSAGEQSLSPKAAFKTPCTPASIPYVETFYHHATGEVEPECWTVASAKPQVWVVSTKTYDDEGTGTLVRGSEHIYASGGATGTEQVFAMPALDARLDTLEVAFDYKHSYVGANYGVLEIGYMTNPSDAGTFVSLTTLPQVDTLTHAVYALSSMPADASFIAFRFAGGTSSFNGVSMDNFVVAPIGHSDDYTPEVIVDDADAYLLGQTYCEAQISWYSYNADAFAIGLFDAGSQQLIAGIVVTTGECDRFAYEDGITFSEYEDPDNHYYCSTKWILNVDDEGLAKGAAWSSCVTNIGTAVAPVLGLKPGSYQVQIYPYNATTGAQGTLIGSVPFTLTEKVVTGLQASVAADKTSATLTWVQPELANGERIYVSVRAGETVAYDNFETADIAVSPLTFSVTEGKSYTATVQVIDRKKNPLGAEVACDFTVGVNNYEPQNPTATVFGGDNVTFTWDVTTQADFYDLVLYCNSEYYTTLSVRSTTKTTTMPKDGTWSWTVQAFTQGTNGNYFPASNAIAGNDFVSKGADIPEDAVVMNVWGMEAAYLDQASGYYEEGKHGWFLQFATGEEDGTGYPLPSFLIYTDKENAISGVYNVARANIDLESCYLNATGRQSDAIQATDAEVRLQFDGYDEEKAELGYRYAYYTGQFRLVGADGKTYIGKFMELFCNSYNFSTMSGIRDHKGMWDEDPDYNPPYGVENIQGNTGEAPRKVLIGGQIYILRGKTVYTITGQAVK